jgi:hypothetical protein
MKKSKVETHIDVVNSVTRLEDIIRAHTIPDELVGDCVLIDAKKMMDYVQSMKDKITANFSVELKRKDASGIYEPLKVAIKTMNNGRKRNTDEPKTSDNTGEIDMGEIPQSNTLGKVEEG